MTLEQHEAEHPDCNERYWRDRCLRAEQASAACVKALKEVAWHYQFVGIHSEQEQAVIEQVRQALALVVPEQVYAALYRPEGASRER